MASWGKNDAASNAVFAAPAQLKKKANTANQTALYGNTTVGAFVPKAVKGQFAVDATEIGIAGYGAKATHTGWHLRTVGTGSILTITISAGGTGYANTDLIRVTAPTGGVNAAATLSTNSTGGITSITITNTGSGFITTAPTVAVTNATGGTSGGSGATLVATAGGRAGRVHFECLVAGGISSDGSDDTVLPDA